MAKALIVGQHSAEKSNVGPISPPMVLPMKSFTAWSVSGLTIETAVASSVTVHPIGYSNENSQAGFPYVVQPSVVTDVRVPMSAHPAPRRSRVRDAVVSRRRRIGQSYERRGSSSVYNLAYCSSK